MPSKTQARCTRLKILKTCGKRRNGAAVRKLASTCKVSRWGAFPWWPWQEQYLLCGRLLSLDTSKNLMSAVSKTAARLQHMKGSQKHTNAFTGNLTDMLAFLAFLRQRHGNECVFVGRRRSDNWGDHALVWNGFRLAVPPGLFANCAGKRFLVALLLLHSAASEVGHANLVVYDFACGLLERFDPLQSSAGVQFRTHALDRQLRAFFQRKDRDGFSDFISPDVNTDLTYGLQREAEAQQGPKTFSDPAGYCLPWSVLYADARLSLPNEDPTAIPELLRLIAKNNLHRFIQNYVAHVQKTTWEMAQTPDKSAPQRLLQLVQMRVSD